MIKQLVKQALIQKENKRYNRLLAAKKATYGEWLAEKEKLWSAEAERLDGKSEKALDADWVLVCVGTGEPASHARKSIACYFIEHPEAEFLYGDEDVRTGDGEYGSPWFKPDWSPDLLDSCFYFGSLMAVRRQRWEQARISCEKAFPGLWQQLFGREESENLYRVTDLEGCEKWAHVCLEEACAKKSRMVGHIPQILFHAKSAEEQQVFLRESEFLTGRRRQMMEHFCEKIADHGRDGRPAVSVVIPSKDQPKLLAECVSCVRRAAGDIPCEILVVDNGSSARNREQIEGMLSEEAQMPDNGRTFPMQYLYRPMEFNFSAMCNMGAAEAKGKQLLFLNDDVMLEDGCIREMAVRAARDRAGAVGMKLLYPDSDMIQHDGIVNLPVGPVHKLQYHEDNKCYYYGRNRFDQNCAAVTGACLMIDAEKFREAGGFREELRVAYNDVELGFRLLELGYYNVVVNGCHAWHHESLSRGSDESPEKQRRLEQERALLYQMHPAFYNEDPYYPQGLNREGLDSRMVPEYVTCKNKVQGNSWEKCSLSRTKLRRDDCLMVRVETAGPERIQGYSVILGDNNARYEKYLLLIPEICGEADNGVCGDGEDMSSWFCMKAEEQYRQDLEENLPDQEHVALGGFCVSRKAEKLPPGTYRIGMLAVNRVNGLKLWNESGKRLTVGE